MTNHVHLLVTPQARESVSRMVQYVGRRYVTYVNRCYARSGTLWEGRHKGCLVSSDNYLLACMRYIELNPVRAGMVETPGEYPWSSHGVNVLGGRGGMLLPHAVYEALGETPESRGFAYRELFRSALAPEEVHRLRCAVQTGTPLGNDRFRVAVEAVLNRAVGQARRGRPRSEPGKGY